MAGGPRSQAGRLQLTWFPGRDRSVLNVDVCSSLLTYSRVAIFHRAAGNHSHLRERLLPVPPRFLVPRSQIARTHGGRTIAVPKPARAQGIATTTERGNCAPRVALLSCSPHISKRRFVVLRTHYNKWRRLSLYGWLSCVDFNISFRRHL